MPAPVPAIIENIVYATIPIERDLDLTQEQKDAIARRGRAIRQATAAQFYAEETDLFYAEETVERVSFYELFASDRRELALTFGTEHGQSFAIDAAPKAAVEPEEEEIALVWLSAPEDNFAGNIVELALMAARKEERDLERTWSPATSRSL